jgi:hypothetical protein
VVNGFGKLMVTKTNIGGPEATGLGAAGQLTRANDSVCHTP